MSTNSNEEFTPEDELKAENELLKLKIELEHGGLMGETNSALPPEIENEFLKNIMQFEEQYKNTKRIKVYDLLGKPGYKPASELSGASLELELDRLIELMDEKGLAMDFICEYEDIVKYKFITEELFQHETDDMHVEGMTTHFTYEEFHPNHEYDLKHIADEFLKNLLERDWNPEFSTSELSDTTLMNNKEYDNAAFSALVKNFQDSFTAFEIMEWKINSVSFNLENETADLNATLCYKAFTDTKNFITMEGNVRLAFVIKWDYWRINYVEFPGLHS